MDGFFLMAIIYIYIKEKEKSPMRVKTYIKIWVLEVVKSSDKKTKDPSYKKIRAKTKTTIKNHLNSNRFTQP